MTEMSVATLAKRLEVTQRRANQIVASGQITARRTDSGAWLVDTDSADAYTRRHRHTRGLTTDAAWALLFVLAGRHVEWISASTLARVKRRIREHSAATLAHSVAGRTQTRRYRAANLTRAEDGLLLTGRSAIEALETDLLPDRGRLFGYVPHGTTAQQWATTHFMVADAAGAVHLFENTIPQSVAGESIPASVVAADLAVSADARERAAGVDALQEMRATWMGLRE